MMFKVFFRYAKGGLSLLALFLGFFCAFALEGVGHQTQNMETQNMTVQKSVTDQGACFFLSADFIYWTTDIDGFVYGTTGTVEGGGDTLLMDREWCPGFKVKGGAGVEDWKIALGYTHYTCDAQNSDFYKVAKISPAISVTSPIETALAVGVEAEEHFRYRVFDLEFRKTFPMLGGFEFVPFFGVKGMWQKQTYRIFYQTLCPEATVTMWDNLTHLQVMNWGIGPRVGLDSKWKFIKYFGVYANFALGGIWMDARNRRKDVLTLTGGTDPDNYRPLPNVRGHSSSVRPVIEFNSGLFLETFNQSTHGASLMFHLGWEFQMWPNQIVHIDLKEGVRRFDLILYGFTGGLGVKW